MADPKLREDVEGSSPNQDLHETYFYINPVSNLQLVKIDLLQEMSKNQEVYKVRYHVLLVEKVSLQYFRFLL